MEAASIVFLESIDQNPPSNQCTGPQRNELRRADPVPVDDGDFLHPCVHLTRGCEHVRLDVETVCAEGQIPEHEIAEAVHARANVTQPHPVEESETER